VPVITAARPDGKQAAPGSVDGGAGLTGVRGEG
jgi:hypothetical protein